MVPNIVARVKKPCFYDPRPVKGCETLLLLTNKKSSKEQNRSRKKTFVVVAALGDIQERHLDMT